MFYLCIVLLMMVVMMQMLMFLLLATQKYVSLNKQKAIIKNYQNFLEKGAEDQCMNMKQKLRIKTQKMSIDIFSKQN